MRMIRRGVGGDAVNTLSRTPIGSISRSRRRVRARAMPGRSQDARRQAQSHHRHAGAGRRTAAGRKRPDRIQPAPAL